MSQLQCKMSQLKMSQLGLREGECKANWENVSKSAIFFWQASPTNPQSTNVNIGKGWCPRTEKGQRLADMGASSINCFFFEISSYYLQKSPRKYIEFIKFLSNFLSVNHLDLILGCFIVYHYITLCFFRLASISVKECIFWFPSLLLSPALKKLKINTDFISPGKWNVSVTRSI